MIPRVSRGRLSHGRDSPLILSPLSAPRLLISCGEPSGDLYGGELLRHLRPRLPGLEAFGLGGEHVLAEQATLLGHVRDLAMVGIVEVVRHLGTLRRIFKRVLTEVDRDRPDLAVLVDYPSFNLRLAREMRRRGVPVAYYVSPQIWAWKGWRIREIRRNVAHIAGQTHAVLGAATVAIVASGTATVEAALLGTPMVVVYRVSPLTYTLGRPMVRVPHVAMANLIAGREVVRELIQADFAPDRVAGEVLALLDDPGRLARVREELGQVRVRLGAPGASGRAAEAVLKYFFKSMDKNIDMTGGYM